MILGVSGGYPELSAQHFTVRIMLNDARGDEVEHFMTITEAATSGVKFRIRAQGECLLHLEGVIELWANRLFPLEPVG